jgi:hypothetical protein
MHMEEFTIEAVVAVADRVIDSSITVNIWPGEGF